MCCFLPFFLIFIPLPLSVPKGRNAPGKPVREVSETQAHCHGFCLSQLAFCAQHACDTARGCLGLVKGGGGFVLLWVLFGFAECIPHVCCNSGVPLNFQWRQCQLRDLHFLTRSQRWKIRNGEEKIKH